MTPFRGYLPQRRVRLARTAALATVAGGTFYLSWRALQLEDLGPLAWVFFVAELLTCFTLVTAVPLMWTPRPRRWAPPPQGSLDVFVTVCGEDRDMVAATVRAALDIDYPHNTYILNDGRRAGVANWEAIDRLAARLGVPCFTRTTGIRGKAGNLNHALARTDGDFVAVVDADHLARPDLADDLLGHFHPRVAFVATRQDFRIDANDHLGNAEVFFYAVIQPAKDADNAAFSCGNGVVYRRDAIDDIGGFSEWNLVEDLHTSYELHARGWQSVYVPRPVTTGTAPGTAAEMAAQRLRWATDSLRLFFWDNPFGKRGLTWRQKLHYAQTTGVYYLATALQVMFLVMPGLSLLLGIDVLNPESTLAYLWHLALFLGPMAVMLVAFAGARGALRLFQMQSFLAPVFALAAWRAFWMRPGRKARAFSGVTAKSRQQTVNRITLVQHGIFVFLLIAVGVELGSAETGEYIHWGAILWALVMAATLATQNSMVSLRWETAQSARIALTAPVAACLLLVLLAIWSPFPGGDVQLASSGTARVVPAEDPVPPPREKLAPPRRGAYLGMYDPDIAYGDSRLVEARMENRFDGAKLRLVHRFQTWYDTDRRFSRAWADYVAAAGGVPMITWESWARPVYDDPDELYDPGQLAEIAAGENDRYLRRWAKAVADYRKPVVIRLWHEMNGTWYPWAANENGNTPEDFVAAWRHVVKLFDRHGARNVSWVWSVDSRAPDGGTPHAELASYYPGDRYVDWTGISGFNWGPEADDAGAEYSFAGLFDTTYATLSESFDKPIMLSEIGVSALADDPEGWITAALEETLERPRIKAVVWYSQDTNDADFSLGEQSREAFGDAGRDRALRPRLRTRELR